MEKYPCVYLLIHLIIYQYKILWHQYFFIEIKVKVAENNRIPHFHIFICENIKTMYYFLPTVFQH